MGTTPPFDSLDFLYIPTQDVAVDASYFPEVLGGRMTAGPPHLLFTDHVDGERPILIYRVDDFDSTIERLQTAGWKRESVFEIPQGPCCSFRTPGGHRGAVYELARPQVEAHFRGRIDF